MNTVFCQKLREARKDKNLTQKQVATILNVVESCYANWEQGRSEPGITALQNLCGIFDVSADFLLGFENDDGTKIPCSQNIK
ncbi:MAG: helix-turn-helix domain-containing protein [Firmicutes bacterium]|nr:helix-turn-helix domain-containing protein [Bacillota bacterium]